MRDDILSYRDMCDLEKVQTLQRGMNFRLNPGYSVILMSQRSNAPYQDQILEDGLTIVYEGHDVPRTPEAPFPKTVDQPLHTKSGQPTQNGKFVAAVENHKAGASAELVRVYEKLVPGIWSFKGVFDLTDYEHVESNGRTVLRFRLTLSEGITDSISQEAFRERTRLIPTEVKKEVWIRDGGRCVICGASDELHFDHDIPYSKGGSSITARNVKILCARHNLSKSDKIE